MTDSKGILMLAQNNTETDYIKQASVCAMSIKATNPDTSVSLVTDGKVKKKYKTFFDNIIDIPWQDDAKESTWKIENRWKLYHATPYQKTIVLDTDMLVLQNIDSWWNFLENYKVYFTSKVFTYRGDLVESDYYRKAFTANGLPNLYSGFHYFEKSEFAHQFYTWLELVVNNWELFYGQFVKEHYPKQCSIDVSAAIVAKILDCDTDITNNIAKFPSFVHMKPKIQGWAVPADRWQDRLNVYMDKKLNLKLGNFLQNSILHYTEKDFVNGTVTDRYEEYFNV